MHGENGIEIYLFYSLVFSPFFYGIFGVGLMMLLSKLALPLLYRV